MHMTCLFHFPLGAAAVNRTRPLLRLIAAVLLLGLPAVSLGADVPQLIGIPSVIDGDTIELHGERIRLFGKIISCSDALVCPGRSYAAATRQNRSRPSIGGARNAAHEFTA
jgi:hypothetical protein